MLCCNKREIQYKNIFRNLRAYFKANIFIFTKKEEFETDCINKFQNVFRFKKHPVIQVNRQTGKHRRQRNIFHRVKKKKINSLWQPDL